MAEAVDDHGTSRCARRIGNHLEHHKEVNFRFAAQACVQKQPLNKALKAALLDALDDPFVEGLNDRGAVQWQKLELHVFQLCVL